MIVSTPLLKLKDVGVIVAELKLPKYCRVLLRARVTS
jgi:hypothetical protein